MPIPNLHDRRALETIVARMDTHAIGHELDEGGLSAFAREVVAEELARRVLADVVDYGRRAAWPRLDQAASAALVLLYLVSLGGLFGLYR
jgi:hypothetical protein